MDSEHIKNRIIADIILYRVTKDKEYKGTAKNNLLRLAKIYRVTMRARNYPDKNKALIDFILNENGYVQTINNLYSSLG